MSSPRLPHWAFGVIGATITAASGIALLSETHSGASSQYRLALSVLALAVLAHLSVWLRAGRRRIAFIALWSGTALTILAFAAFTPSAVAQAASILYLLLFSVALLVGAVLQALVEGSL